MPTTMTAIDMQVHELLHQIRAYVSEAAGLTSNGIGLSAMISLLIRHWQEHLPELDWVRAEVALLPKRGRPRRSHPQDLVARIAMRKDIHRGHELVWRRKDYKGAHRVYICKHCDLLQSTWDFPTPPWGCPRTNPFSNSRLKTWTKKELLALSFEPDEVEWATDEPESATPKEP